MTAKHNQKLFIALSIFFALCLIGFSLTGTTYLWFWQKYPIIPILLLLFVFFVVQFWLKLEIERQRQHIHSEYTQSIKAKEQTNIRHLL